MKTNRNIHVFQAEGNNVPRPTGKKETVWLARGKQLLCMMKLEICLKWRQRSKYRPDPEESWKCPSSMLRSLGFIWTTEDYQEGQWGQYFIFSLIHGSAWHFPKKEEAL